MLVAVARAGAAAQPSNPRPGSGQAPKPGVAQPAAVERKLAEAVRRDPDSFEARYQLASFYLEQGKLKAALPHLQRACAINPNHYASGGGLLCLRLRNGSRSRDGDEHEQDPGETYQYTLAPI